MSIYCLLKAHSVCCVSSRNRRDFLEDVHHWFPGSVRLRLILNFRKLPYFFSTLSHLGPVPCPSCRPLSAWGRASFNSPHPAAMCPLGRDYTTTGRQCRTAWHVTLYMSPPPTTTQHPLQRCAKLLSVVWSHRHSCNCACKIAGLATVSFVL